MAVTMSPESEVQSLYIRYFGRPADYQGLDFWISSLGRGSSVANIKIAFQASPEFQSLYAGRSASDIVTRAYDFLFGRVPDPEGLAFWSNHLKNGNLSLNSVLDNIINAAIAADQSTLAGRVDAAMRFTLALRKEKVDFSRSFDQETGRSWLRRINSSSVSQELAAAQVKQLISRLNGRDPGLIAEETSAAMKSMLTTLGGSAVIRVFYDMSGSGNTRLAKNYKSLPMNDEIIDSFRIAFARIDSLAASFQIVETSDLTAADIEVHVVQSLEDSLAGQTSSTIRSVDNPIVGRSKSIYSRIDALKTEGVDRQYLASHEALHAFGGEHSFDGSDGDIIPSLTTADSMLAYQHSELARNAGYESIYTPLDEALIRYLYS